MALWIAHLQALTQGPQVSLFGSTIQRHISVILPAVLRNRTLKIAYSMLTYLRLEKHIPLVTEIQGKESERWSSLRGQHCPATTPHYSRDEQILSGQTDGSGTITNTKYEISCPTKIFIVFADIFQKYYVRPL